MLGFQPKVSRLYPAVEYPVPCDTPSLQPFVTWEHSETYAIPDYLVMFNICKEKKKTLDMASHMITLIQMCIANRMDTRVKSPLLFPIDI